MARGLPGPSYVDETVGAASPIDGHPPSLLLCEQVPMDFRCAWGPQGSTAGSANIMRALSPHEAMLLTLRYGQEATTAHDHRTDVGSSADVLWLRMVSLGVHSPSRIPTQNKSNAGAQADAVGASCGVGAQSGDLPICPGHGGAN